MIIYYQIFREFCKYPWQNEIEESYCLFSYSRKKFCAIPQLKIDSNTSIQEKKDYLKKHLNFKIITVIKIK